MLYNGHLFAGKICRLKKLAQDASQFGLDVMHPAYIWPSNMLNYIYDVYDGLISFFCRLYAVPPKTPSKSPAQEAYYELRQRTLIDSEDPCGGLFH